MENLKQPKVIILAVVTLVLVVVITAGAIVLGSSKSIFKTTIKESISKLNEMSADDKFMSELYKSPLEVSGNLKVDSKLNAELENSVELQKLLNSSKLSYTAKTDSANEFAEVNMSYTLENSAPVNFSAYADKDKAYMLLQGIYDKYILIDDSSVNYFNEFSSISASDYVYLSEKFAESFISNLDSKYLTTSKETLKLDKDLSVKKTSLNLGKMVDDGVIVKIFDEVLADQKCVDIIVKILNDDQYTTKESIQTLIKESFTKQPESEATEFVISVYTKGLFNDLVMVEAGDSKEIIQYIDHKTTDYTQKFIVLSESKEMISILVKEIGKDKYDITVNSEGAKVGTFNGIISNKTVDLTYELNLENGEKLTGTIKATSNIDEKNSTAKFDVSILVKSNSFGEVTLTNTNEFKKIDKVTKPDFTNSISAEAMSTSDMFSIMNKLSSLEIVQKFNELAAPSTMEENSLDYNYNQDSSELYDLDFNYDYENLEY